jgi:hypothetical protein
MRAGKDGRHSTNPDQPIDAIAGAQNRPNAGGRLSGKGIRASVNHFPCAVATYHEWPIASRDGRYAMSTRHRSDAATLSANLV